MAEQQPEAQSSNMAQAEPGSYGKPPLRVTYKVPFSLRLRYTISSIAHFFRIMQQQQNYADSPEFLPIKNGQRVVSYRDSLSLLYLDPKMSLSRDHWKVTEIQTFKDKGTKVKHEYMVATFRDGGKGEVLLRIERRIQDSSAKAFGKAIMRRSRSETSPSDSDSGKQSTAQPNEEKAKPFKKNAVDEVALVPSNSASFDKQELVQHIIFKEKIALSLPQLILLACAVNDYSKEYHFFEQNCYWFCYLITELLKKLCGKDNFENHPTRARQGTWLGLPTESLWRDINFEVLSGMYTDMSTSFMTKIDSIINHPDNKHLKEAERLLQEEKLRAEEERRRAAESDKRAAEEKRRAEDLERQLAELKAQLAQSKA